jgi:hypothetical protein
LSAGTGLGVRGVLSSANVFANARFSFVMQSGPMQRGSVWTMIWRLIFFFFELFIIDFLCLFCLGERLDHDLAFDIFFLSFLLLIFFVCFV